MSNSGTDETYRSASQPGEPGELRVRNSVDLGGFFGILRRQRIWIVVGFVIMFGLAFAYILFSGLAYTSTISILIDARDRQPIGSDAPPLPQQADPVMVESQLKLMTSAAVLKRVAIAENLESDPEFAPSDRVGLVGGLMNLISRGKVQVPPMDQITDALAQRITVKRPERSYVVDLDVKSGNPGKAARLANAVAKAFIEEERAAADAYAQDQSDWVIRRTKELRGKVEIAEKRVQDYKAQNGIVDVQGTLTQEQQLQDANRDLVAARNKVGEAQSRYDQVKKIIASGKTLEGTYDAINSTVIRQLRVQYADLVRRQVALSQKYGERHPEYIDIAGQVQAIRTQINDEMQRIASALQNEAQVAHDNAEAAQRRVQILEQKTTATNEVSLKLKELQRLADGERANYEKFLRANDSIRRDPTETPYARIVAPASFPAAPSSPKTTAALLIAATGGLSLGIGLAVFMDRGPAPVRTVAGPLHPLPPQMPRGPIGPAGGPVGGPGGGPSGGPGVPHPPQPPAPETRPEPLHPTAPPSDNPFAPLTGELPVEEGEDDEDPGLFGWKSRLRKRRPLVASLLLGESETEREIVETTAPVPMAATIRVDRPVENLYPASPLIDPRDLTHGLLADLAAGRERRVLVTAERGNLQKTELCLTLARAVASNGHAALLVDGDEATASLSHLAVREGSPARIQLDGMEAQVIGIPSDGVGVIFVLPQQSVTGDLARVDSPFIACRINAVIVDGAGDERELARFAGLAEAYYRLDPSGHLRLVEPLPASGPTVAPSPAYRPVYRQRA